MDYTWTLKITAHHALVADGLDIGDLMERGDGTSEGLITLSSILAHWPMNGVAVEVVEAPAAGRIAAEQREG